MNDPDEIEIQRETYESIREELLSPEVRARMLADGVDPDAELKRLSDRFATYEAAARQAEAADELLLQSLADKADAFRNLYRLLKRAVAEKERENPLDPHLAQAREFLETLSKEVPKSDCDEK